MIAVLAYGNDTLFVSGAIQHESLFPTADASSLRTTPRADWAKIDHLSNNYLDLSLNYINDSNKYHFRSLRASVRLELNQWPMPGYEAGFAGHGLSHLSVASAFDWGEITVGDVYAQFGSGVLLNVYEERSLGIDGALRGAKCQFSPYKGIHLIALGGKQRRYWNCYSDGAWGWNYGKDAVLGADMELHIEEWSKRLQDLNMVLQIGGSYVSKYQAMDTVIAPVGGGDLYMYNLPLWVGAGAVRAEWQWKGWSLMAEYAYKANDPGTENRFSYKPGDALFLSTSYSRKGLSFFLQIKKSSNLSFRSDRMLSGIAGRLNNMPVFAQQHTYSLATTYAYATQPAGEWAIQSEFRYTWARKTKMGGKYGTSLKIGLSHVRGGQEPQGWMPDFGDHSEYYTDINIEFNKRLSKQWWLNAMLMYQAFNQQVVEGHGEMIRSGIAVVDVRYQINKNIALRSELQYLYTPHDEGQWIYALMELSLYHHWMISGDWKYNIGGTDAATHAHYYTAGLTYTHGAHRAMLAYVKTQEGYNCSGGICRFEPQQEGVSLNYSFSW